MRQTYLFGLSLFLMACGPTAEPPSPTEKEGGSAPNWSIAIHGGAGHFDTERLSPEQQAAYRASLTLA